MISLTLSAKVLKSRESRDIDCLDPSALLKLHFSAARKMLSRLTVPLSTTGLCKNVSSALCTCGVTVADRAITGVPGKRVWSSSHRLYDCLKSCQSYIKCASSMAMRPNLPWWWMDTLYLHYSFVVSTEQPFRTNKEEGYIWFLRKYFTFCMGVELGRS